MKSKRNLRQLVELQPVAATWVRVSRMIMENAISVVKKTSLLVVLLYHAAIMESVMTAWKKYKNEIINAHFAIPESKRYSRFMIKGRYKIVLWEGHKSVMMKKWLNLMMILMKKWNRMKEKKLRKMLRILVTQQLSVQLPVHVPVSQWPLDHNDKMLHQESQISDGHSKTQDMDMAIAFMTLNFPLSLRLSTKIAWLRINQ